MSNREKQKPDLLCSDNEKGGQINLARKGGALLLCGTVMLTAACGQAKQQAEPQSAYSGQNVVQAIEKANEPSYWPTGGWKTTKPEEHGVDSGGLAAMVDEFKDKNLHSFVLIRDGFLLAEGYNSNWDADKPQPVYSVTKSFTSAITGMAIKEGMLTGTDQRLGEFFPEVAGDENKANITIGDLLSMTSGLEWDNTGERSSHEMADAPNWLQYVLSKPVVAQPGTQFNYSNGNAHVMSGILQKVIGIPMSIYANHKIFLPLGIKSISWATDLQGVTNGAWSLQLTARDMAKFGFMFLQGGHWEGKEIVPPEWVEVSVQQRVAEAYADGTQGGYGYFWWLKPLAADARGAGSYDVFCAAGSGGQRIFVIPDLNVVFAVTANEQKDGFMPEKVLALAMKAVKSNNPLPANDQAEARLKASLQAFKSAVDKAD